MLKIYALLFIIGILIPSLVSAPVSSLIGILMITAIIFFCEGGFLSNSIRSIKARTIKSKDVLIEVDRELGIFSRFNQKQNQVLIILPRLTKNGDVEYIKVWRDLSNVIVHNLEKVNSHRGDFSVMKQLVSPVREHLQIEQDISQLQKNKKQIEHLLKLVSTSEFYYNQRELYDRALFQVQEMIDKAKKLEQAYIRLIRELLIGEQLSSYNPNQIENYHLAHYSQYQKIKEEYQQLKDTAIAYGELLQNNQL